MSKNKRPLQVKGDKQRPGGLLLVQGIRIVADVRIVPVPARGRKTRDEWSIHCRERYCTYAGQSSPALAHALYVAHYGEEHDHHK